MKLILLLLTPLVFFGQRHYGTIDEKILKGVVYIVKGNSYGTGFLVTYQEHNAIPRIFLVTNKHMIGSWNLCDQLLPAHEIEVTFYTNEPGRLFRTLTIDITNADDRVVKTVLPHPDQQVDVALIDVTHDLVPDLVNTLFTFRPEDLKAMDSLPRLSVGLGDPVFALGYPSDIRSLKTNLPIAKVAYISSVPDTNMELNVRVRRRDSTICRSLVTGRIFLVDGNIIGGNSGGPVVLGKQPSYATMGGLPATDNDTEKGNPVIGIVSQGLEKTGINIIYGCDYILELINEYKKRNISSWYELAF